MRNGKEELKNTEWYIESVIAPECIMVNTKSHRYYKCCLIINDKDYNRIRTSDLFIPKKFIYMPFSKWKKFKWVLVLLQ